MGRIVFAVFIAGLLLFTPRTFVLSFSIGQISALTGLLSAFGVPQETITHIDEILTNASTRYNIIDDWNSRAPVGYVPGFGGGTPAPAPAAETDDGIPDWVPTGATVFLDFVNHHYWVDGAEKTLSEVIEANDSDAFDLSQVTATGMLVNDNHLPKVSTIVLNEMQSGITVLYEVDSVFFSSGGGNGRNIFGMADNDNMDEYFGLQLFWAGSDAGPHDLNINSGFGGNYGIYPTSNFIKNAINKIAFTIPSTLPTSGHFSLSVNGGSVGTDTPTSFVSFGIVRLGADADGTVLPNGVNVRSLTVYPEKADSQLPALSTL